jgi:hypothetical protein
MGLLITLLEFFTPNSINLITYNDTYLTPIFFYVIVVAFVWNIRRLNKELAMYFLIMYAVILLIILLNISNVSEETLGAIIQTLIPILMIFFGYLDLKKHGIKRIVFVLFVLILATNLIAVYTTYFAFMDYFVKPSYQGLYDFRLDTPLLSGSGNLALANLLSIMLFILAKKKGLAIIIIPFLILTESRTMIFLLFVFLMVYFLFKNKNNLLFYLPIAVSGIVILTALILNIDKGGDADNQRLESAQVALSMVNENVLLGQGLGSFYKRKYQVEEQGQEHFNTKFGVTLKTPHSAILLLMVELGIVASFILFIVTIVFIFYLTGINIYSISILLLFSTLFISDAVLIQHRISPFFFYIIGILAYMNRVKHYKV